MTTNTFDDTTTHVVSYWYIPGSSDYNHAEARTIFCGSIEEAERTVSEKGANPPEMAFIMTREEYLSIQSKLRS